jgi:uncharacterized repeat protein (TIGR01451 family)
MALAASVAVALLPSAATARVVSNVANISWMNGSAPMGVRSNQVDIQVDAAPQPPLSVDFYHVGASGGGGISSVVDGPACTTSGTTAPSTPVSLTQSNRFSAGEAMGIGIRSAQDNRDPATRDSMTLVLRGANGDTETVTLREDAPNSGFFIGYIMTKRTPPAYVAGDCHLSVDPGTTMVVTLSRSGSNVELSSASLSFLVDPYGVVFDSGDGAPVPGSRVTIVNADTGQPAQVFGDDGVSAFPSSVITGTTVTDGGGTSYAFPAGDYRFPYVAPGRYRLVVEPATPYSWASTATAADLAGLTRPDDGQPFVIGDASYGRAFTLATPAPVRIDIPVDKPGTAIVLAKTSSVQVAVPGDTVYYRIQVRNADAARRTGAITVTDDLPRDIRLRAASVRYNGERMTPDMSADGRGFSLVIPGLAPAETGIITYIGEVRPDAQPGDATNTASARDARGTVSNVTDASVRVRRDILGDRLTIIGRITAGGCSVDPAQATGVANVRVMLQDGSFAVTDIDGRYHFEGVRPGTSVVQIDPTTLPAGQTPVDCARNTRAAGSAISRFIDGRGGELKRADFHVAAADTVTQPAVAPVTRVTPPARPTVAEDADAAGAHADFMTGQAPGIAWLFPAPDYNPRAPTVRIAIKHLPGQRVELSRDGRPVNPLNYDGAQTSPDGGFAVSLWRGVEIGDRTSHFFARVMNADGTLAQELTRDVHYADTPMRAALVAERSLLLADGLNRPVIAVRLTDSDGRPVKNGTIGDFDVAAPHRAAVEVDAEQARQLAGMEQPHVNWRVEGDDGVAYIELQPTTASGSARLTFRFRDREISRTQELDVWLNPGERPWTVVGFVAGSLGYNTLKDRMEPVAETLPSDNLDGRVALYAQGRILGQWLMTMSYDSDKEKDETRFSGVIDPRAYYTIYADRSDNGYDAASVRNLYLRLERPQFYALFGDFATAINEPELTRYQRSMNGVKAEYRGPALAATAFVADTPYRYRRDEMQGNGLSGPYQLGARDILANSETVRIEVRDRLRSNIVIDTRTLTRHIDYDIDYFAGTLRFREPILSRDSSLNPQFIIADYEVDGVGQRVTNAGGRVSWRTPDERLRVGATLIHDETDSARTNMGGVDVRYRPTETTEVRAEYALSDASARNGAPAANDTGTADAWLLEVEHRGADFDLLAYARQRDAGFGVGQLTSAGEGSRRYGVDGKLRLTDDVSLTGSAWREDYLTRDAQRTAARLLAEWRADDTTLRAGLTYAEDDLSTGETNRSALVQLGATQRLFDNRLELDAQTEFALGGDDESVDFPARHHLGARYNLTSSVALVGAYEIADGGSVKARTARFGIDARPWNGGRVVASGNQQDITEYGPRSFAAYGLTQSFQLSERVSIDATLDGQRTLSGIRASDVLDPAHPVASGGLVDGYGSITEDFTAVTLGATFRDDNWSLTTRAEYRDGELGDRYGLTVGGIRRIGEGRAFGGLVTFTRAASGLLVTQALTGEVSWAHRPAGSAWSWLDKLEARLDSVDNAVAGQPGPIGGPALTIDGNARSHRIVNSLGVNYTPLRRDGRDWFEAGELSLFWGVRWNADRYGYDDVAGWSTVLGADVRMDVSEHVALGLSGNARAGTDARAMAWALGPQIVLSPMENANIIIGYNMAGYRDRDFEEARYSRQGLYATFRLKIDQTSLHGLGL